MGETAKATTAQDAASCFWRVTQKLVIDPAEKAMSRCSDELFSTGESHHGIVRRGAGTEVYQHS